MARLLQVSYLEQGFLAGSLPVVDTETGEQVERRLDLIVNGQPLGWLLLLTMIVLFVTTWLALFLAKLVTRPLAALAEATQEISRGRLDYRVDVRAT